jgi:hypothetical protein
MQYGDDREFTTCHSLTQQNLCAKPLKMANVFTVVATVVTFITSRGTSHRRKKIFCDMESEYLDSPYSSEVRWLNSGRMLKCGYYLKSEMELFVEMKAKHIVQLCDQEWM